VNVDRPNYAREIRFALTDAMALCERLGLTARGTFTRQPRGAIVRCPWHEDRSPSCSVRLGRDGTIAVRCHACGATGDALSLVAQVHGLSLRANFRDVLLAGAELAGLHGIVAELESGRVDSARSPAVAPRHEPEPERDYPDSVELSALLSTCVPTAESPEVAAWIRSRGLDPVAVDSAGLAVALPSDGRLLPRFATYKGRSWVETGHTLIVPMRDAYGAIRSVRAGRVGDGESPKRLPPGGHKATALVMADPLGVAMLTGEARPNRVTIVEGEPDFLTWATRPKRRPFAVLGIVSGSWCPAIDARIPKGTTVVIRTDNDRAGDAYAAQMKATLRRGRFVSRSCREWTPEGADDDHEAA